MTKIKAIPDNRTCETCLAYWRDRKCDAYPQGIPTRFWNEKEKHLKVEKDQILDSFFYPMPGGVY